MNFVLSEQIRASGMSVCGRVSGRYFRPLRALPVQAVDRRKRRWPKDVVVHIADHGQHLLDEGAPFRAVGQLRLSLVVLAVGALASQVHDVVERANVADLKAQHAALVSGS